MLLRGRMSLFQRTLGSFLGSVVAVFVIILIGALFTRASGSALNAAVVTACTFLGLAWVVLGWAFVPSVETYLGPGASRGIPIIWPSSAIPQRNARVLDDLKSKLSGQTDMGITIAALGFLLMAIGFVFFASASVGVILVLGFLACLAAVLAYTYLPSGTRPRPERAKAPPNP